jgi:AraC family transcriptional regulator
MRVTTVHYSAAVAVRTVCCDARPGDAPYTEIHPCHSLSFVRRGSFGCRACGATQELVVGSVTVGRPGLEYVATHEHHDGGDECLSIKFSAEHAAALLAGSAWGVGSVPPLPRLVVLGELLQASIERRSDLGVDEVAMMFAAMFAQAAGGPESNVLRASASDRRRAVDTALWLDRQCGEAIDLEAAARQAGLSPFHYLRVFARVLGVTPHQYLLRARLRHAARLAARQDGFAALRVASARLSKTGSARAP